MPNLAWTVLESSEHDRELALNKEVARLRKLDEEAKHFNKKANILGNWISDTEKLVAENKNSANDVPVEGMS